MISGVDPSRPLWHGALGRAEDAVLVAILMLAAPILILLIGMPIVRCLRTGIELLGRL